MDSPRSWYGPRLFDVLAVVAVMGILAAIFLPAVQSAREAARRMSCQCHLKQVGLGLQNYADTTGGVLPANLGPTNPTADNGKSWMIAVLPFIANQNLFIALSNYDAEQ